MGGAGGDLYPVNLSPQNPGTSLPGNARPRGSIGGSDVGANERDDQRVRDLIEEYMEEFNILNQLNLLNLNSGGSDTLIAEYYNSANVIIIDTGTPSGMIGQVLTGTTRNITMPGGPVRLTLAAQFAVENYEPLVASLPSAQAGVDVSMFLYMDGVLIAAASASHNMYFTNPGEHMSYTQTVHMEFVLEPGKRLVTREAGSTSAAEITAALAAGDHTFRVDLGAGWSDDEAVAVHVANEYIAFHAADTNKITSLQLFDATTPL